MIDSRLQELADQTIATADYIWDDKALKGSLIFPDYGDALIASAALAVAVWERQNTEQDRQGWEKTND